MLYATSLDLLKYVYINSKNINIIVIFISTNQSDVGINVHRFMQYLMLDGNKISVFKIPRWQQCLLHAVTIYLFTRAWRVKKSCRYWDENISPDHAICFVVPRRRKYYSCCSSLYFIGFPLHAVPAIF